MSESLCGSCTLCCKLMRIDELDKPAGSWCEHCNPRQGCGIYEQRPQGCRDFECVWLQSQLRRHGEAALPAEARPDRSRVVLNVAGDSSRLVFHVDPAAPEAHRRGVLGRLYDSEIRRGHAPVVVCGEWRSMIGIGRWREGDRAGERIPMNGEKGA